jgi:CBS domain-containing protein
MMNTKDQHTLLARTEPFAQLDQQHLASLCHSTTWQSFNAGDYVFRQGDPSCGCLFVIARGIVEIIVADDCQVESVVGLRQAGDFFGETVVLSGQQYPGSARAIEPLTCLCIQREDLESLIYSQPEFSGFFNALLAERMRLLYERNLSDRSCVIAQATRPLLFRTQVIRAMSSPVATCREADPVSAAAGTMIQRQVGCLVVVDTAGGYRGLLTERQMVAHLVAEPVGPVSQCTAGQIMDPRQLSISPEAFLGEALVAMIRNRTRHLVVVDRDLPVGVIAFSDLVRSQSVDNLMLIHDIADQTELDGLADLSSGIDRVLDALMTERAGVRETMEIMSRLNDRITRKVIALSEAQMRADGWGPPPVDYCWINMGSAARYEQTLRTDQDNAIIFADPQNMTLAAASNYFQHLAGRVVDGLAQCGFSRCSGGVMASRPNWCRSISQWRRQVGRWMGSAEPEDTRRLTILLDFRSLWGSASLADALWDDIIQTFSDSISAGHMLSWDDGKMTAPIGLFGRINTERSGPRKGRINLKTAALVHMINAVRLLAVSQGITTPSTFERLERLAKSNCLGDAEAALYGAGFETLMMFKIRENLKQVRAGDEPDNTIDPRELDKNEMLMLKDALSAVIQLQKHVSKRFRIPWMNYFAQ